MLRTTCFVFSASVKCICLDDKEPFLALVLAAKSHLLGRAVWVDGEIAHSLKLELIKDLRVCHRLVY